MPSLPKNTKKKGGKHGSKKGAAKLVPDPDAEYKQQLDEIFYLSKPAQVKLKSQYTAIVDVAIKASTMSVTSVPTNDWSMPDQILMVKVPEIVRSLGLCVTDEQMEQICCMVSQVSPPPGSPTDATREQEPALSPPISYAETAKVRLVLSEILRTHVLAYDPQVLARPDPRFPTRVSSVIYKVSEHDLVSCFESIWDATGRKLMMRNDDTQVRCFTVDELEAAMAKAQNGISAKEPISKKELEDLYFFVKDESSDVVAEDTFLRCLTDVK